MNRRKLLIVWVHYPAVGHLVEAFEAAANYYSANNNLEIHVLVNSKVPHYIGNYCSMIHKMYAVDVKNNLKESDLGTLSKMTFEYVVFPRSYKVTPNDFTSDILKSNNFLINYFKPTIWLGYSGIKDSNKNALNEINYSPFKLIVPENKIDFKIKKNKGPIFALILKGSSKLSVWPSFNSWKLICKAIKIRYPHAQFLITGISKAHLSLNENLIHKKIKIDKFINSIPGAINCYDIGLDNQLGIIKDADILLSPHTGFAFLGPSLGTPWLALSGGEWGEQMHAQKSFYNVLPSCKKYPCNRGNRKLECNLRIKYNFPIKCMSKLSGKIPDLLIGVEKLLDENYSFTDSFKDYETSALKNEVNFKRLWRIKAYKESVNE